MRRYYKINLTHQQQQPLIIKMQFCVLIFTCLSQVFMCCWPANNLLVAVCIFIFYEIRIYTSNS